MSSDAQVSMDETVEKDKKSGKKNCWGSFLDWFGSPSCVIYSNYALSAWGDWMWQFAAGLYLVYLAEDTLRLAAIYGFTGGTLILLFGGVIGNWVDKTGRLKAVRITLFVQNASVSLCATTVCLVLVYHEDVKVLLDGQLRYIGETVIIVFALVAYLASMAYKLAIEKDWIVVVAGDDKNTLANLNAVTRAIDLSCKILAPTVAGLVMTYASLIIAAVMIAVWNVLSVFVEYALLRKVYNMVPRLAIKLKTGGEGADGENKAEPGTDAEKVNMIDDKGGPVDTKETPATVDIAAEKAKEAAADREEEQMLLNGGNKQKDGNELNNGTEEKHMEVEKEEKSPRSDDVAVDCDAPPSGGDCAETDESENEKKKKSCLRYMVDPFIVLGRGWTTYARQRVVFAGLGLAGLYMTVLGFDSVTTGYIYASGVSPSLVGVSMALAGVTGVMGTVVFTCMNRRIGLERTGLFAFNFEIMCLTLTVASIWVSGSPFDPYHWSRAPVPAANCTRAANATPAVGLTPTPGADYFYASPGPGVNGSQGGSGRVRRAVEAGHYAIQDWDLEGPHWIQDVLTLTPTGAEGSIPGRGRIALVGAGLSDQSPADNWLAGWALEPVAPPADEGRDGAKRMVKRDVEGGEGAGGDGGEVTAEQSAADPCEEKQPSEDFNISITLFLIGIVTSRVGLWMVDLVVTQLLQENVLEKERGIVNGVQNSLNMLMDMLKFILVIFIPDIETFGYLIIISFIFICMAGCLFAYHSWRVRGHLFHFEKICGPCGNNNHLPGALNGTVIHEVKVEADGGLVGMPGGTKDPVPV